MIGINVENDDALEIILILTTYIYRERNHRPEQR
jgi:hypothetical protein